MRVPLRPVIIVDPVDSGVELAPAFAAREVPAIAVRSMPKAIWDELYGDQLRAAHFLDVLEDGPDLLEALRRHAPRAVIAGDESGVELADRLAAELTPHLANVPALSRARRHKGLMQAALERAGLPVIRTLSTSSPCEVSAWLEAHDLVDVSLVVKPAASAGSDNVHIIAPGGDWRGPFDRIIASRNTLRGEVNEAVIVQERVVGTEFAVDTVSAAGDHVLAHLIRYAKRSVGEGRTVFDHTEIVGFDPVQHGEMIAYVRRVLDAVGIRWGAAHSEIMLTSDGPRLIEVGARTCGGPVLGFSRVATGSSQLERLVEAYLDGEIRTRSYDFRKTVVPVFLHAPRSGVLGRIEALDGVRELPTHLATHLWRGNGDWVSQTVDWDSLLGVVALAGDRDTVFSDYNRVREAESRVRFAPATRELPERSA